MYMGKNNPPLTRQKIILHEFLWWRCKVKLCHLCFIASADCLFTLHQLTVRLHSVLCMTFAEGFTSLHKETLAL